MTRSINSLSLLTGETSSSPSDSASQSPGWRKFHKNQLWIAVLLPNISLESHPDYDPNEITVVVEPEDGHHRVVVANKDALEIGINRDLKLSTAYALSSTLRVLKRYPDSERAILEAIARRARQITPVVSLVSPQEFLIEVQGSLKLFGGLRAIKKALQTECECYRLTVSLCAAPTALAALWLVRHRSEDVRSTKKLVGNLGVLPLKVTGWPERTQLTLRSMGLQTIGDCLRLPRDGFIRRIGREYLLQLDRSLGEYDSSLEFRPSQSLSSTFEFMDEVTDPAVLSRVGESLIQELVKVLRKRQVGVASFDIVFQHLHRLATVERINLLGPTQDQERFLRLFLDRLERVILPAPVVALALRTGQAEVVVARNMTLFSNGVRLQPIDAIENLIERLRGRFGTTHVFGISFIEEHRPEVAWSKSLDLLVRQNKSAGPSFSLTHQRPLWLLPSPIPVPAVPNDFPHCHRQAILLSKFGPERIEAGWWSGKKVSRDYYMALNNKGQRLWIYKDHYGAQNWYLHGIFS